MESIRKTSARKLTGPLIGAAAAGLVWVSAGQANHLGSLLLGHANATDATTSITGNLASPVFRAINSGSAAAIRGDSKSAIAVTGVSVSGAGQYGESQTGIGLSGRVASASAGASSVGVQGVNNGKGVGLRGVAGAGSSGVSGVGGNGGSFTSSVSDGTGAVGTVTGAGNGLR